MFRPAVALSIAAIALVPVSLPAQQRSVSYTFLEAVREGDGTKVTEILNQPGQQIVNTKDRGTGETALHIVARRSDGAYLRFLLAKGANPNVQDAEGNTPAMIATERGFIDAIAPLKERSGNMNLANARGETPLIRAVQLRNIEMIRALMAAGASPDKADVIAGMSARDYATRDTRTPALLRVLNEKKDTPKREVAGPKL